jgi:hypothetical protein
VGEQTVARVDAEGELALVYPLDEPAPVVVRGVKEAIAAIRLRVRVETLRWQRMVASP